MDTREKHVFVQPVRKHWFSEDYRRPVPQEAPDFARKMADAPISFPHDRFVTSMWPCRKCTSPDEVVGFLSQVPLVGRKIEGLRTYGPCPSASERAVLRETGDDTDYEDEDEVRSAYLAIPATAGLRQRIVARYAVSLLFHIGGTFEIDGECESVALYLAMNQIDHWSVRPQDPVNMDIGSFFRNLSGRTIERVEVASSHCERDPYRDEKYEKPKDLVDGITFWLDDGAGLRFRPDADGLAVEIVDADRNVKVIPWGEVREAFYTDSDILIDPATACVSRGRRLLFGSKGRCVAEKDCVGIGFLKSHQVDAFGRDTVAFAAIRREYAALLSLTAFKAEPAMSFLHGWILFTREEWMRFLDAAEKVLASPMTGCLASVGELVDRSNSSLLLRDLRDWSRAVPETATSVQISNVWCEGR